LLIERDQPRVVQAWFQGMNPSLKTRRRRGAMSVPLDEYWAMVVADWDQTGTMRARWLSKTWRDDRVLYRPSRH
jgi:hypothetical protein